MPHSGDRGTNGPRSRSLSVLIGSMLSVAVADYTDLFAAGLGFDITGAILVAQGLRTEPDAAAGRTLAAGNTFSAFNVRAAEDFADGKAGVLALVIGFALQAIGYALSIGGVSTHTNGGWAAIV